MDVEHRSDVELRHDQGRLASAEFGQVHQQLAPAVWAGGRDRQRPKVVGRVDPIGRQLDDQGIADAVPRIDPEVGRRLGAAVGGDQHVVGRERLVEAELRRQGAIDIDGERRRIRNLEDMGVDDAGHALQVLG